MFEDEREKFWRIYREEDERRKINIKRLSKKIGFAPSTVYKFHQKCAGSHDLLESISVEIFGVSWTETIAKQEAERNQGREADTVKEGVAVNIGDLYIRIGEMQNEFKKQFESLNLKLDGHISNTSAHQHHDKKNSSGTNQK